MYKNVDTVEEYWEPEVIEHLIDVADQSSFRKFCVSFSSFLGVPLNSVLLTISGKAALSEILRSRVDDRPGVLVHALNCVRVQEAVTEANCLVRTYDFKGAVGVYDWAEMLKTVSADVGVLIVTHFYGVPSDLREVRDLCNKKGILLIEDCAQTLGASIEGKQVGTIGDAAIYSFSYDKPISLGWGGAAVVNNNDHFNIKEQSFAPSLLVDKSESRELFQTFWAQMRKRRSRIRVKKKSIWGVYYRYFDKVRLQELYQSYLPFSAMQAELGVLCLENYQTIRGMRNSNAALFKDLSPFKTWPEASKDIEPAWLKQKVAFRSKEELRVASRALQSHGFRAGNFNWPSLIGGEMSYQCEWAREVSELWMDVPVHQGLSTGDIGKMAEIIESCL